MPGSRGVFEAGKAPESTSFTTDCRFTEYRIACRTARSLVGAFVVVSVVKKPRPEIGTDSAVKFDLSFSKSMPATCWMNCDWPLWSDSRRDCGLRTRSQTI